MAQSFADKLKDILNEIKNKYNMLVNVEQIALKTEVKSFINCNPRYGPNSSYRQILDPKYIYKDESPYLYAFISTYNEPQQLNWITLRMIIDYMLDSDKVNNEINQMH